MRALERQPSPQQRFVIDLAETPTVPTVWTHTNGSSMVSASPPMPWAPLAGPLTTQGLHGARLRQAHSPRPYSVARHAVAAVTATHHPQRTGVASPAVAARPCHSLQSPRRLQPQEVYEMQHPRPPRPAERPPLPPPQAAVEVARTPNVPPLAQGPNTLVPGTELQVGFMRLRCEEMLGSGSYSTVWLANVVSQSQRQEQQPVQSVALKDVFCRGEAALQQSLFEVQLLMAVERRMNRSKEPHPPPRLPRCLTYQVDPSDEGWSVRMALTRLKGEQLDGWLQRSCEISDDSMLQRCRAQTAPCERSGSSLKSRIGHCQ
ncbi:unnamed protein product [Cladocopium goreaui]|uniref:Protein kinase domain-containing protein n=1 Tax=Cladocopium goreaui TaxID=2562237 RepID=A0A9P1GRJ6_9DINO|nr:unnamed protein product [Cladocopium goreaui]